MLARGQRFGCVAVLVGGLCGLAAPAGAQTTACAPLASPASRIVRLTPADAAQLSNLIADAASGTTILLADGTYRLGRTIVISKPGITIRSGSGNAGAVILDAGYEANEGIQIAASNVTLAQFTITRTVDHLVHLVPNPRSSISQVRLSGLRLVDAGEQFVKVNPNGDRAGFADLGVVECSEFLLTEEGRKHVETLGGTSCYTGGIDVHSGRAWVVRGNRFEGIYCRTGFLAEHAIHFWQQSADTVVENNLIIDCARGIGFGLGPSGPEVRAWPGQTGVRGYVGHRGGVIRNNVIVANVPEYDTGIGLEQALDVRVLHNTVFEGPGATRAFSSIDARFANTRAAIHNNLVRHITVRGDAPVTSSHNLERASAEDFVDAAGLNFHLRAGSRAIGAGLRLDDAKTDYEGRERGERPDVGAFERPPIIESRRCSSPVNASARTRSSPCWAPAAWVRFTGRATRDWAAMSH